MLDGLKIWKMIDVKKQGKKDINIESLRKIIGRMPTGNSPKPNKVTTSAVFRGRFCAQLVDKRENRIVTERYE